MTTTTSSSTAFTTSSSSIIISSSSSSTLIITTTSPLVTIISTALPISIVTHGLNVFILICIYFIFNLIVYFEYERCLVCPSEFKIYLLIVCDVCVNWNV
eukprot:559413_1